MKKESILFGVIGLIIGILVMMVLAANAVNTQNTGMMRIMGIGTKNPFNESLERNNQEGNPQMSMGSSMDQMMGSMKNVSGYQFDQAFINAMIVHHEGAIKMAEQAKHRAEHQELRDLAEKIISAQTAEIEQMREWKKTWLME
jgi:uncharacterized protein (DUF305 family)